MLERILSALSGSNQTEKTRGDSNVLNVTEDVLLNIPNVTLGENLLCDGLRIPSGLEFPQLYLGPRGNNIIGFSKNSRKIIKIELYENARKSLNLRREATILRELSEKRCTSCPTFSENGELEVTYLLSVVHQPKQLPSDLPRTLPYLVQENVKTADKMPLADLILAIIEQKNLGYYHGDLKPANIRNDEKRGVCVLVDYDQAESLDRQTSQLNAHEFLQWCDKTEQRKYGFPTWRRHFPDLEKREIDELFQNGAFDLSKTTLYKNQTTTNTLDGVYHTINERDIFADGIRDLDDRVEILNAIEFSNGERVLDVGCNAGLLCHYLNDRGCKVTGAEVDPLMVTAAGIIARITQREIEYLNFDMDEGELLGQFDTIMLFSVLHHSQNVEENARNIAESCERIIIECRPKESGKKLINDRWKKTSEWVYADVNDLISGLESLFPGFLLSKNYGIGGKNRNILEFKKLC